MSGLAPINPEFNSPPLPRIPRIPPRDKHFWLVLLLASAVLLPRSALIMRQQNECMDADFHLRHGLAILLGTRDRIIMGSNDPPLGQVARHRTAVHPFPSPAGTSIEGTDMVALAGTQFFRDPSSFREWGIPGLMVV